MLGKLEIDVRRIPAVGQLTAFVMSGSRSSCWPHCRLTISQRLSSAALEPVAMETHSHGDAMEEAVKLARSPPEG